MKKRISLLLIVAMLISVLFTGCDELEAFLNQLQTSNNNPPAPSVTLDTIPEFDGSTEYVIINEYKPFFEDEKRDEPYEMFSELDELGRCGTALACIGVELMPTEDRGEIGNVTPSGWQSVKYDIVSGKYLYNRSHLIGFQLTGENDNEKNLITGTRYFNVEGMLPFENMVAAYVKDSENMVLYRVTPIFKGDELVARGVLMEAMSVGATREEDGEDLEFCVYVYNNQPGIVIDYATGESRLASDSDFDKKEEEKPDSTEITYVLNTNSKRFHKVGCSGEKNMSPENREETDKTREELLEEEYIPCGTCKP